MDIIEVVSVIDAFKEGKATRAEMRKAMGDYIGGMTKEELEESLERAGLSFYKNIRTPIFSHLPDHKGEDSVS